MTLEEYAYLAEIIGVIIVVVTLLYLAVQVRQGARLMRSDSRQALLSNQREVLSLYLDHMDLFDKLISDEQLSRTDQRRFSVIWLANMRNREHEFFQYKDGILDEETWRSYRAILGVTLSSRRHRAWWNKARPVFDSQFVEMVDSHLSGIPESESWEAQMGEWEQAA